MRECVADDLFARSGALHGARHLDACGLASGTDVDVLQVQVDGLRLDERTLLEKSGSS